MDEKTKSDKAGENFDFIKKPEVNIREELTGKQAPPPGEALKQQLPEKPKQQKPEAPAASKFDARDAQVAKMGVRELVMVAPKQRFLASGASEEQFLKESSFAVQIIEGNDFMRQCAMNNKNDVIDAIVNVALTGLSLNPVLSLGYLVPYKGKIKFQSSYMGKREIVMRTGLVKDAFSELVYKNDNFSATRGSNPTINHNPDYFSQDRGELVGGYWVCILKDGTVKSGVMPKKRIDEIQKRSQAVQSGGQTPWKTDYEEMAKKTIFNWGFKEMPKTGISESALKVLEAEAQYEQEMLKDWVKEQQAKEKHSFDMDEAVKGKKIIDIEPM